MKFTISPSKNINTCFVLRGSVKNVTTRVFKLDAFAAWKPKWKVLLLILSLIGTQIRSFLWLSFTGILTGIWQPKHNFHLCWVWMEASLKETIDKGMSGKAILQSDHNLVLSFLFHILIYNHHFTPPNIILLLGTYLEGVVWGHGSSTTKENDCLLFICALYQTVPNWWWNPRGQCADSFVQLLWWSDVTDFALGSHVSS